MDLYKGKTEGEGVRGYTPRGPQGSSWVPPSGFSWKLLVAPLILPLAAVFFWVLYAGIAGGFGWFIRGAVWLLTPH